MVVIANVYRIRIDESQLAGSDVTSRNDKSVWIASDPLARLNLRDSGYLHGSCRYSPLTTWETDIASLRALKINVQ